MISVKVCWEQWCRWNCDLRVINARNRHFLLYWKLHHDTENHVHICALRHSGESLQNGNRLGKNSWSNLQGWSSDAIVCSWAFVYFLLVISSFLNLVRCVAFQSFLLCLLWLSQQARPHQGACLFIGCFILFSQFIHVCFIKCKNLNVLFILVQ